MGKSSKVMPQLPHYPSFLLGKGGKLLHLNPVKNIKTSQSVLSDHKSLQCTCLDHQCLCDTLQNCPLFAKLHVYSLQILHLSSNRREQSSAPPFQFVTPGRELTQKSIKPTNFEHFYTQKVTNFSDQIHLGLKTREHSKSTQKDTNFEQMHSMTPVNCHQ